MRTGRTKEKIAIVVICMLSFAALRAQVTQKGIVLLQNSRSQPLGQVSILVSGAPPVASDSRGEFTLHFATRKAGDAVRTLNVSKTGYELVNTHDLELWNISSDNQFIVVIFVINTFILIYRFNSTSWEEFRNETCIAPEKLH